MGRLGLPLLLLLLLFLLTPEASGRYGLVRVVPGGSGGPGSKDYCALFKLEAVSLPRHAHQAPLLPLHDWTSEPTQPLQPLQPRHASAGRLGPLHGAAALVLGGNLSLPSAGRLAQRLGAHGLLIVVRSGDAGWCPAPSASTPGTGASIPVAILSYADMLDILSRHPRGREVSVALYMPPEPPLDLGTVVIFALAVGTVAAGGYCAGLDEQVRAGSGRAAAAPRAEWARAAGSACTVLPLLFFFCDQLVSALLAALCLGVAAELNGGLAPLARVALSATASGLWLALRPDPQWAWPLQDVLGTACCLLLLGRLRLPSFRACASLLLALLASGVFLVFGTPLFTRAGRSLVAELASTGREKLPLVFRVPRLGHWPLAPCRRPFSILGLGDVVVPGLLVAYCGRFDTWRRSGRVYFAACTAAYGLGLMLTFGATALMPTGQPALLYLVSSTLAASLAVAAARRELPLFWAGPDAAGSRPCPVLEDGGPVREKERDVARPVCPTESPAHQCDDRPDLPGSPICPTESPVHQCDTGPDLPGTPICPTKSPVIQHDAEPDLPGTPTCPTESPVHQCDAGPDLLGTPACPTESPIHQCDTGSDLLGTPAASSPHPEPLQPSARALPGLPNITPATSRAQDRPTLRATPAKRRLLRAKRSHSAQAAL
ncbi:signal peptide peptidase-like 2B [Tachyglossus aculeatus]|uniref:signal peptide peptidase-like 2B n=1 Tax=Tachyglossus aculeatus TaxID=9261 RepID=UPI0018F7819A|nr:signal peptide peptidase-like 2B [Tachyglossus aculeatus]